MVTSLLNLIDLVRFGQGLHLEGSAKAAENLLARRIPRSTIKSEEVPIDGSTFSTCSKSIQQLCQLQQGISKPIE